MTAGAAASSWRPATGPRRPPPRLPSGSRPRCRSRRAAPARGCAASPPPPTRTPPPASGSRARWRPPTATPASATPTARGSTTASTDLAERLGPQALVEQAELAHARDRLAQARAHLASPPAQPYAWLAEWPPEVAGAILRDLPTERLEPSRAALRRLADEAAAGEPLLALAAGTAAVAAVTPTRVLVADEEQARVVAPGEIDPQDVSGLDELEPGHLAAVLELVTAALRVPAAEPAERSGARAAASVSAEARPMAEADVVELLHKLGDLRDAGVLTEDEFAAKKAELLRRI